MLSSDLWPDARVASQGRLGLSAAAAYSPFPSALPLAAAREPLAWKSAGAQGRRRRSRRGCGIRGEETACWSGDAPAAPYGGCRLRRVVPAADCGIPSRICTLQPQFYGNRRHLLCLGIPHLPAASLSARRAVLPPRR